jgi:hypothetical protein
MSVCCPTPRTRGAPSPEHQSDAQGSPMVITGDTAPRTAGDVGAGDHHSLLCHQRPCGEGAGCRPGRRDADDPGLRHLGLIAGSSADNCYFTQQRRLAGSLRRFTWAVTASAQPRPPAGDVGHRRLQVAVAEEQLGRGSDDPPLGRAHLLRPCGPVLGPWTYVSNTRNQRPEAPLHGPARRSRRPIRLSGHARIPRGTGGLLSRGRSEVVTWSLLHVAAPPARQDPRRVLRVRAGAPRGRPPFTIRFLVLARIAIGSLPDRTTDSGRRFQRSTQSVILCRSVTRNVSSTGNTYSAGSIRLHEKVAQQLLLRRKLAD